MSIATQLSGPPRARLRLTHNERSHQPMPAKTRATEQVMDAHIAQWAVRAITRLTGVYAVGVGATILEGGPGRFVGLSYSVAIQTPGAPSSWGAVIATAGVLMLVGSLMAKPRAIGAGALLASVWSLLFACAFAIAAARFESANTTAPWVYGCMFILYGLLAGSHFAMHPVLHRRGHE